MNNFLSRALCSNIYNKYENIYNCVGRNPFLSYGINIVFRWTVDWRFPAFVKCCLSQIILKWLHICCSVDVHMVQRVGISAVMKGAICSSYILDHFKKAKLLKLKPKYTIIT